MYRLATKCTENIESNTSNVNKATRLFVRRAVGPVGSMIGYHRNSWASCLTFDHLCGAGLLSFLLWSWCSVHKIIIIVFTFSLEGARKRGAGRWRISDTVGTQWNKEQGTLLSYQRKWDFSVKPENARLIRLDLKATWVSW